MANRRNPNYTFVAPLVDQGLCDREIAARLPGATQSSVRAFRRRNEIVSTFTRQVKPAPAGYRFEDKSVMQVAADFGCRWSVAKRWFDEADVQPVARRQSVPRQSNPRKTEPQHDRKDDRAISILRGHYANVFRCDIVLRCDSDETYGTRIGLPDRGAGHWHVEGVGVVDYEGVTQLATKHGLGR